jgi:hypothetical protein
MHKTIYIDSEDEITSIVAKIRREAADELYLFVPKDAILVEGVINLEILRREAEKINKKLVFKTNDKRTQDLLRRLDLSVESFSEKDFSKKAIQEEDDYLEEKRPVDLLEGAKNIRPTEEIGSSSFYETANFNKRAEDVFTERDSFAAGRALLSEKRSVEDMDGSRKKSIAPGNSSYRGNRTARNDKLSPKDYYRQETKLGKPDPRLKIRQKEAEEFFSGGNEKQLLEKKFTRPVEKGQGFNEDKRSSGLKFFFFLFFIVIIMGAIGSWLFINFPRVTVYIYPSKEKVEDELEIKVSGEKNTIGNTVVAGQLEEMEIVHELKFEATGEEYSSDKGKARGQVIIKNYYSSDEQPLVATTRMLSENGKLFRLVESVIVPGMSDEGPGEVEARVVADEPGSEYNLGESKFTIEGFKGSPKYEKFEVVSVGPMEGGLDDIENQKVKVVTQKDIEEARTKVIDSLNNVLEGKIRDKLGAEKEFLIDSVEKEITETSSSLKAGDIGDQFSYTVKQKIKLIVFKKSDVRSLAEIRLKEKTSDSFELDNESIGIVYQESLADFEKKELTFRASIEGLIWPVIDHQEIKIGLARKNENEITEFLQGYSSIKKAEIKFEPDWLSFLPITEKKVFIEEKR